MKTAMVCGAGGFVAQAQAALAAHGRRRIGEVYQQVRQGRGH